MWRHLKHCTNPITGVIYTAPLAAAKFYVVETSRVAPFSKMSFLEQQRNRWCAVIALVAVCALTVSLATRYSSPFNVSSHKVKSVQSRTSPDSSRQRLTKNAANWMPPTLTFAILPGSISYSRIAPASPPVPSLLIEQKLYTRPPPTV